MKFSWRYKITLLLLVAVIGAIAITWILNKTFLEDYYLYSKMDTLDDAYQVIEEVLNETDFEAVPEEGDGSLSFPFSEDALLRLEILTTRNNLSVFIVKNNQAVYYSTDSNDKNHMQFFDRLIGYMFPGKSPSSNSMEKITTVDDLYDIYYVYDKRINSNFLELFQENSEAGDYLLIRTNIESLKENVDIANTFLAYGGVLVALIVSLILFFAAKSFVRPVEELSGIARRMSQLDFNVKYRKKSNDEIGELGDSINLLSERLEKTVSDLKSANNKLQTDIEEKVQIDEMRKEFLSNVTHELKTPIALIQGYAEGLKDNITEDVESREFYCDVIIDEAAKMNKMVKKLLTLNQIEFGNQLVEMGRFDITALIASVVESSDILLKQNEITLYFDASQPVEVWADEYMIEEVVTNYLTNAIHHAGGEKIIEIKLVKLSDRVRISVFNTGTPIPEEELEKIWIKFYKVDKARTREYGGSGIGLSIVKAIMDSHNKQCGVISHSNGVEFWFELDAGINS